MHQFENNITRKIKEKSLLLIVTDQEKAQQDLEKIHGYLEKTREISYYDFVLLDQEERLNSLTITDLIGKKNFDNIILIYYGAPAKINLSSRDHFGVNFQGIFHFTKYNNRPISIHYNQNYVLIEFYEVKSSKEVAYSFKSLLSGDANIDRDEVVSTLDYFLFVRKVFNKKGIHSQASAKSTPMSIAHNLSPEFINKIDLELAREYVDLLKQKLKFILLPGTDFEYLNLALLKRIQTRLKEIKTEKYSSEYLFFDYCIFAEYMAQYPEKISNHNIQNFIGQMKSIFPSRGLDPLMIKIKDHLAYFSTFVEIEAFTRTLSRE